MIRAVGRHTECHHNILLLRDITEEVGWVVGRVWVVILARDESTDVTRCGGESSAG